MRRKMLPFYCLQILALLATAYCFNVEPADLCFKKHEEVCENKHLSSECGKNHCAFNRLACDAFIDFSLTSRRIRNSVRDYHHFRMVKYQSFLSKLKKCNNHRLNSWAPKDVCLNKNICLKKRRIPLRTGDSYIYIKSSCKCGSNLSIQCENIFCVARKDACEGLKLELWRNSTLLLDINRCKN